MTLPERPGKPGTETRKLAEAHRAAEEKGLTPTLTSAPVSASDFHLYTDSQKYELYATAMRYWIGVRESLPVSVAEKWRGHYASFYNGYWYVKRSHAEREIAATADSWKPAWEPWQKPMTVTDMMLSAAKKAEPKVGRDAALRIYRAMLQAVDSPANSSGKPGTETRHSQRVTCICGVSFSASDAEMVKFHGDCHKARFIHDAARQEYDYRQRDNETDENYAKRIVRRCDELEREGVSLHVQEGTMIDDTSNAAPQESVRGATPARPAVAAPTPRTDEEEVYYSEIVTGRDTGLYWVRAEFARQLERELAGAAEQLETESGAVRALSALLEKQSATLPTDPPSDE